MSRKWIYSTPIVDSKLDRGNFSIVEEPLPRLREGQALARVILINIHSGTRARMVLGATRLGETDTANYACAEIVDSKDAAFKPGDIIACQAGWQEFQVVSSAQLAVGYAPATEETRALNGTNSQWTYVFRPSLAAKWSADILMDVFGTSGMTAYFGVRECGPLGADDDVLVAGASGSTGSLAAQLCRNAGARVIGLAGGKDRCAWTRQTLAITGCIDYRAADLEGELSRAFPRGIDMFLDGVGGRMTALASRLMKEGGRLFSYGSAGSFYDATIEKQDPSTTLRQRFGISSEVERILADRNVRIESWIVDRFYHQRIEAEDALSAMLADGSLKAINNVVSGFENLPDAIAGLYNAPRAGKLQVRFQPDPQPRKA